MKPFQIYIIMIMFFFSSCTVTDLEITFSPTFDFEGNYSAKLDCDEMVEDVFKRNMEISIINTFGSRYEIEIDRRKELVAVRRGDVLILEDQGIDKRYYNEELIIRGEIRKSRFDDLDFEFVLSDQSGNEVDCLLELKSDS